MDIGSQCESSNEKDQGIRTETSCTGTSWKSSNRTPRYYTPFTARAPWLLAILVAVLACVAVLETAFQKGTRGGDGKASGEDKRWIRRQANTSSASETELASTAETAYNSITTSPTASSEIATSVLTSTTVSASYISVTTSSKSTSVAPYATKSGYITISTTSTARFTLASAAGSGLHNHHN